MFSNKDVVGYKLLAMQRVHKTLHRSAAQGANKIPIA